MPSRSHATRVAGRKGRTLRTTLPRRALRGCSLTPHRPGNRPRNAHAGRIPRMRLCPPQAHRLILASHSTSYPSVPKALPTGPSGPQTASTAAVT